MARFLLPPLSCKHLYTICAFALLTWVVSASDPLDTSNIDHHLNVFSHFREPYDQRLYGILHIEAGDISTSSIQVKWSLTNRTSSDSKMEATALCETPNGKIVSNKLTSSTRSFTFELLSSNTKYLVCVYLLEKSSSSNTSILHYSCDIISTIPLIRVDSVVGVLLTLGYMGSMVGLGYVAWRRKVRQVRLQEEKLLEEEEEREVYPSKGQLGVYEGADGASMKMRAGCSGSTSCIKGEKEEMIHYDAKSREISF
ncbi:uncharacterized protein LOC131951010 [Physella acuta]|uniref:uncharacterized protein LOC131951010 n=1 Tax=Physella acuta TaxID=109671 RepID=UPI0027DDBCA2|nr:uncharacterized protein LOC131951010 [Physella acuta]